MDLTANDENAMLFDALKAIGSSNTIAPQRGSPRGSVTDHMETNPHIIPRNHYFDTQHASVHRIDRFNYTFASLSDNSYNQLVYIHNYPQNKPGGFYFLNFSYQTGQITILECLSHPVDMLQVCDSIYLCIYPGVYSHILHTKREAKLAYDNYKQDCLSKQRYGISYETYMNNVISSLIDAQCGSVSSISNTTDTLPSLYRSESNGTKIATVHHSDVKVASDDKS